MHTFIIVLRLRCARLLIPHRCPIHRFWIDQQTHQLRHFIMFLLSCFGNVVNSMWKIIKSFTSFYASPSPQHAKHHQRACFAKWKTSRWFFSLLCHPPTARRPRSMMPFGSASCCSAHTHIHPPLSFSIFHRAKMAMPMLWVEWGLELKQKTRKSIILKSFTSLCLLKHRN